MHFSTVSTLFFAALATAQHQHFHQRRQYNTTGTALGEQTTLTVYATSVHTITSCAATVTDCPARSDLATSEQVVTDTIAVYTTVCPVAQAESASSALLASVTSSAIGIATSAYPTVPLSTGASSPVVTGAPGAGSSVVLTYTLGSGTSTTIVTTTIKHYSTVTEYAVKATSTAAGVEGASSVEGVVDEPTTTYTQTSTSTRYITVEAVTATGSGSGTGSLPTGVVGAVSVPGSGACAPVTVTVAASTVTVAASTVTVTETAIPVAASSAAGEDTYPTSAVSAASVAVTSSPAVIMSTATVVPIPATSTPAPYGYSNGTDTATKAPYPSSGFLSIVRTSSTSSAAGVVASSTAVVVPTYSEYPTY